MFFGSLQAASAASGRSKFRSSGRAIVSTGNGNNAPNSHQWDDCSQQRHSAATLKAIDKPSSPLPSNQHDILGLPDFLSSFFVNDHPQLPAAEHDRRRRTSAEQERETLKLQRLLVEPTDVVLPALPGYVSAYCAGAVYIFNCRNLDFYRLSVGEVARCRLEKLNCYGAAIPPQDGVCMCAFSSHEVCLFGGRCLANARTVNKLFVCNVHTLTWRTVLAKGSTPKGACASATAAVDKDRAVVYCCYCRSAASVDCWSLDLKAQQWAKLPRMPVGSGSRLAGTIDNCLYIVTKELDVWALDCNTASWKIVYRHVQEAATTQPVEANGRMPTADFSRSRAQLVPKTKTGPTRMGLLISVQDRLLMIQGIEKPFVDANNPVWEFNLKDNCWRTVNFGESQLMFDLFHCKASSTSFTYFIGSEQTRDNCPRVKAYRLSVDSPPSPGLTSGQFLPYSSSFNSVVPMPVPVGSFSSVRPLSAPIEAENSQQPSSLPTATSTPHSHCSFHHNHMSTLTPLLPSGSALLFLGDVGVPYEMEEAQQNSNLTPQQAPTISSRGRNFVSAEEMSSPDALSQLPPPSFSSSSTTSLPAWSFSASPLSTHQIPNSRHVPVVGSLAGSPTTATVGSSASVDAELLDLLVCLVKGSRNELLSLLANNTDLCTALLEGLLRGQTSNNQMEAGFADCGHQQQQQHHNAMAYERRLRQQSISRSEEVERHLQTMMQNSGHIEKQQQLFLPDEYLFSPSPSCTFSQPVGGEQMRQQLASSGGATRSSAFSPRSSTTQGRLISSYSPSFADPLAGLSLAQYPVTNTREGFFGDNSSTYAGANLWMSSGGGVENNIDDRQPNVDCTAGIWKQQFDARDDRKEEDDIRLLQQFRDFDSSLDHNSSTDNNIWGSLYEFREAARR